MNINSEFVMQVSPINITSLKSSINTSNKNSNVNSNLDIQNLVLGNYSIKTLEKEDENELNA